LRRDAPRRAATFRESTRTRQTRRCRGAIYDLGLGRGRRTLMLNKISRVISQSVSHANNIRGPVNAMLIKRTRRDRAPRVSVIRPPPPPPPPPTPEHSFAGKNRGRGPGGGQLDGSRRRRLPHPTIARDIKTRSTRARHLSCASLSLSLSLAGGKGGSRR